MRGRGVAQMFTLQKKCYLVKVPTKGEGGSKMLNILSKVIKLLVDDTLWKIEVVLYDLESE